MQLADVIQKFAPISLQEMDAVSLQDRTDTKFTFRQDLLPDILNSIKDDYFLLEIGGKRSTDYQTLYYDTKNFEHYLNHHNSKMNRYKTRFRRYVESNLNFFEVKFKSNKERTIKERHMTDEIRMSLSEDDKQLYTHITKLDPAILEPKVWVNYTRMTFVSKAKDERMTIDTNLHFQDPKDIDGSSTKQLKNLVIAEVKQARVSYKAPFMRIMRRTHMRTLSISKYCVGIIMLYPSIKQNNFKPKMLTINKITHGTN